MLSVNYNGLYPTLCNGTLTIILNNQSNIFTNFHNGFETEGTFKGWYFGEDLIEVWTTYEDGLPYEEWLNSKTYKTILAKIPAIVNHSEELYDKLVEIDFRSGSCGGCIQSL